MEFVEMSRSYNATLSEDALLFFFALISIPRCKKLIRIHRLPTSKLDCWNNMRLPLKVLLLCIVTGAASASAQDTEAALNQFAGKTLILRHPLQGDSQRYDTEGRVLKGGNEGSWTVHGGIVVARVALTPDKIPYRG